MQRKKIILTAAGVALAGGLVAGGSALALADTATPSTGTSADANSGSAGTDGTSRMGGHEHTPVTGDELTKVTDAVTAYDARITVSSVEKDPDGSYDVQATKDGADIRLEVSADLATITTGGGKGGAGGRGGMGGSQDTPVTGDEADKVIAAVQAQDSAATITQVRMDPDGSYDAIGTKDGSPVMYDVSADLATITENTAMGGGSGGRGGHDDQGQTSGTTSTDPTDANGTT
ncbi:MAG: hypothetical protein KBB39_03040 [Phycicoccus sp.]|nr:hypothetical protein [Phycicoccus sp.]